MALLQCLAKAIPWPRTLLDYEGVWEPAGEAATGLLLAPAGPAGVAGTVA